MINQERQLVSPRLRQSIKVTPVISVTAKRFSRCRGPLPRRMRANHPPSLEFDCMAEQYIFTIENLGKAYGKREVLKNIWLAFYPGAKIGVIGSNGAGKSSLLRVMAGLDQDHLGTARLTPGFTVGFVPQEPQLNEATDVRGNLEEAVAPLRALLRRSEELGAKFGETLSDAEMEKVQAEFDKVQDAINAAGAWDLDRHLEIAMDAM